MTHPDLAEVMQTMGDVLSIEETEEFVHEVWSSLRTLLQSVPHQLIIHDSLFQADIDGDGNVNYEEFVGMLFKHGVCCSTTSLLRFLYALKYSYPLW